jgi:ubiquitin-activating enzyme E1
LEEEPSISNLNRFQVVVCTETSLQKQLELNNFTHNNDIRFISADIRGLFA